MFPLGNLRGRLEAPEWNEATVLLRTDYPECDAATMPISIPAFPSQRRLPAALALAFLLGVTVCAGQPADRLGGEIVEERRVTLTGSRHPLAQAADFTGPMQPDQLLERAILVLTPDAEQETALEELTRAQQDPGSPDYRQWLTPQAFGERFGVSSGDLQKVMDWLTSHGLSVDEIPASRRAIVFSGTVRQVEAAFHTRMGRYTVSGSEHFANSTDLEIPAGLAAVVKGVVSLHDFRLPPAHSEVPTYTLANGVTLMMPRDWATIYDVTPLYGQGLDGTGQSLAVVGRTDLDLNDVRAFRTSAGLAANDPVKIFVNGVNPGMPNCVDEAESALDVEWAGALAKNATVKFVTAASGATDGVILAAQYAVANNVAPIVSVSYLHCELTLSDGGKSLWGALWSQAAAQGQSVFVASGDSGAAGCDLLSAKTATQGVAVNAICSSPNATCVGGTQFNDTLNRSQYWSASNGTGQSSALSYIPEQAWNETSWSGTILTATGGGVSTVYPRPAWQVGPGVPAGTMRLVPDLAASSAINDAYVIQIQGAPFYVAGTSASTPSIASVMALVLQSTGARLGNVNPALYTLATQQSSGGPAIFHDVTGGQQQRAGSHGLCGRDGLRHDHGPGLGGRLRTRQQLGQQRDFQLLPFGAGRGLRHYGRGFGDRAGGAHHAGRICIAGEPHGGERVSGGFGEPLLAHHHHRGRGEHDAPRGGGRGHGRVPGGSHRLWRRIQADSGSACECGASNLHAGSRLGHGQRGAGRSRADGAHHHRERRIQFRGGAFRERASRADWRALLAGKHRRARQRHRDSDPHREFRRRAGHLFRDGDSDGRRRDQDPAAQCDRAFARIRDFLARLRRDGDARWRRGPGRDCVHAGSGLQLGRGVVGFRVARGSLRAVLARFHRHTRQRIEHSHGLGQLGGGAGEYPHHGDGDGRRRDQNPEPDGHDTSGDVRILRSRGGDRGHGRFASHELLCRGRSRL